MTERIIDLSDRPVRLAVRHGQLVIFSNQQEEASVPLAEVAVLIASNPAIALSQAVLSGLLEAGGIYVACTANRLPAGILAPLEGHHLHAERLRLQIEASEPLRKQGWRQIVVAKILAQAAALRDAGGNHEALETMAGRVRSGDPDNLEAQAARRYWQSYFPVENFRRDRDAPGINILLNYGYMALRAVIARAISAAGLHPALALKHSNRYNAFSLADDLMEPYRPIVDRCVRQHVLDRGAECELDVEAKRRLLGQLLARFPLEVEQRTLFDCAGTTAVSLVQYLEGERKNLIFPDT